MSDQVEPPVKPPEGQTEEVQFDDITLGELTGNDPVPAPQVTPVEPQAAPAAPQVAPAAPQAEVEAPKDDFMSIFGEPVKPKAADPIPGVTPEEVTPPANTPTDTPAILRQAISDQKKAHEAAMEQIRTEAMTAKQQYEEAQNQMEQLRREASMVNPSLAPEVVEATNQLGLKVRDVAKTLSPKSAREFFQNGKDVIDEYGELGEVFDDGYDTRHDALRRKIEGRFGHDADDVLRSLPELSKLASEVKTKISSVSNDSSQMVRQRAEQSHIEGVAKLNEIFDTTLKVNPELEQSVKYAPQNIIAKLIDRDETFRGQSEKIRKHLENAIVPPKPLSATALRGMTPEQAAAAQNEQIQGYQSGFNQIYEVLPLAIHSMAAVPMLSQKLAELQSELQGLRAISPNAPSGSPSQEPQAAPVTPEGELFAPITMGELQ